MPGSGYLFLDLFYSFWLGLYRLILRLIEMWKGLAVTSIIRNVRVEGGIGKFRNSPTVTPIRALVLNFFGFEEILDTFEFKTKFRGKFMSYKSFFQQKIPLKSNLNHQKLPVKTHICSSTKILLKRVTQEFLKFLHYSNEQKTHSNFFS